MVSEQMNDCFQAGLWNWTLAQGDGKGELVAMELSSE